MPRISPFNLIKILLITIALMGFARISHSQEAIIDRVVAVVGKNMILQSDLDAQYYQYRMQGAIGGTEESVKCQLLEMMLLEKLLLNQGELDSVEVSETQVEQSMDERMRYFISQFGTQEKLEQFYGKTILEIKAEFQDQVRDQLIVREVQASITGNVAVTPSDVKAFYKNIPKDSIPLISAQVEIAQVVKIPPVSPEQKVVLKEKLRELRRRVLAGESFGTLAILYSEDPGSASRGGELGFYGRGELFPEFENTAFKLKEGEVSDIVETKAGLHIIQMIERKGEYVNVRHILLKTTPSQEDVAKVQSQLDSLSVEIGAGRLSFDDAVKKYSDDPGKISGGLMINPQTGNAMFEMEALPAPVSFVIGKMEVGDVSPIVKLETDEGQVAYRILMLKKRTEPHRANLDEDYNLVHNWALAEKEGKRLDEWVDKNMDNAYIMITPAYQACDFKHNWTRNAMK